ncbi:unnamed protein product [Ceratitis capitata]|uniref:(Mediterranean fruit fly) hypothetical protein n=1 Tax=Ceratitis capitata TaxID=7213 RepID=A0A811UP24_CERCA|nr:unnamed protein product [Ceratitis capitata]
MSMGSAARIYLAFNGFAWHVCAADWVTGWQWLDPNCCVCGSASHRLLVAALADCLHLFARYVPGLLTIRLVGKLFGFWSLAQPLARSLVRTFAQSLTRSLSQRRSDARMLARRWRGERLLNEDDDAERNCRFAAVGGFAV